MNIYCTNCGLKLINDASSCNSCGAKLNDAFTGENVSKINASSSVILGKSKEVDFQKGIELDWNKKRVGSIIFALGFILFLNGLTKKTSVSYMYSDSFLGYGVGSVNNIGLMQDRYILIIIGIVAILSGFTLLYIGHKEMLQNIISTDATNFKGEIRLDSDAYRLYLTKKFLIEKNETLNKFILLGTSFNDLESALTFAHQKNISVKSLKIKVFELNVPNFFKKFVKNKGFSIVINGVLQQEIIEFGSEKIYKIDSFDVLNVYAIVGQNISLFSSIPTNSLTVNLGGAEQITIYIEKNFIRGNYLRLVN